MILVLTHGCFDILHPGHHLHLEEAANMGDSLIVSITAAKHIKKPGRPVFTDRERTYQLMNLRFVDGVYLCDDSTAIPALLKVNPDLYVKGIDYKDTGIIEEEQKVCDEIGCIVRYTTTQKYSSSDYVKWV